MFLTSYIKSYIEIPLVLGLGLCQSKLLKYNYFKDQVTDDLIIQIKNNIFSLNLDNEFNEFEIKNHQIYLYKINSIYTFVTLVFHDNNVIKSFRAKQLQEKFKVDIDATLELFQDLSIQPDLYIALGQRPRLDQNQPEFNETFDYNPSNSELDINIEEALAALNTLSQFICRYLGPKITSNFLNLSQPKDEWIKNFEIKYSATVTFRGDKTEIVKPLKILLLRNWTQNFMRQCYQLVRDLPNKFEKEDLCEKHRKIISIYTSDYLNLENSSSHTENEGLFSNLDFENQIFNEIS